IKSIFLLIRSLIVYRELSFLHFVTNKIKEKKMSYYNQPPPPVGVPPPQGYPSSQGYGPPTTTTASGYPLHGGYPPQGYPPPPQHDQNQKKDGCFRRWISEILWWTS
uniref:Cysteine-rich and transmembrane domain-containing protein A-like n=1 Tax=Cucumis melo TaxID=3656 RepID=A0A9I9E4F2_CUCME